MVTHSQVDMFTRLADPDVTDPAALREFRIETQPPKEPSIKPSMLAFAEHFDPPKSASPPAGPPPTTFSPYAPSASPTPSVRSAPPTPSEPTFAAAPSPAPSSVRASPPTEVQYRPPPPSRSELDRITSSYLAPSPARSMRSTTGKTFADMVEEIHVEAQQLQSRPAPMASAGPIPSSASSLAPPNLAMKEYAERRELFIRIDDMKRMGFTFPDIPPNCATEDLRQEIDRREISMGTVDKVDTWIGRILKVSKGFHAINKKAGWLQLPEDYYSNMKDRVDRPQFRYNIYKIVLKRSRKSNTSPMAYVAWVLAMPILEGLAIKLFTMLTGWNSPLINGILRSLFRTDNKKNPKNLPKVEGITTGVGGGGNATVIPGDGFSTEAVAAFSGRTASAARGRKKLRPMTTPAPAAAAQAQEPAAEGTEVVTAEELSSLPA